MLNDRSTMNSSHPDPQLLATMKAQVWRFLQQLPGPTTAAALQANLASDAAWTVSHPINEMVGPALIAEQFYGPLLAAMPDLERRTDLFMGGAWVSPSPGEVGHAPPSIGGEGWWCSTIGHYMGTLKQPWLGIPATGDTVTLRFGEFFRWQPGVPGGPGRITEARILLDIVDLARQAGVQLLPPSSGRDFLVPGPQPHNGLMLGEIDPAEGALSMQLTLKMFKGLADFDGKTLASMGMERFWHPNMMWYGPCGIGTSRAVSGFQRHHQAPFLHAFPDRRGAGHRCRIAEGPFVASTGWPSVRATHAGDYLGVPAVHRPIAMRVMDHWRLQGPWLAENWVLIDLPHLLLQMDVDLLAPLGQG